MVREAASLTEVYPQLGDDLLIMQMLLLDLCSSLLASRETLEREGHAVQRIKAAREMLAMAMEPSSSEQLIARLKKTFCDLRETEEDLADSPETISRHGLKLQHLDLVLQLLANVIVKLAVPSDYHPLTVARLQNLRSCCRQAMRVH